jgi:hypothetical protein
VQSFLRRSGAVLLVTALAVYVVLRGVLPALSKLDTDFPNYLTAARIVADHGDVTRLYDDAWFQAQMRAYQLGVPERGKFAPFPPPTALLYLPLARLTPLAALRTLTAVNLLALAGCVLWLARIVGWNPLDTALFLLLSGYALISSLRFGQPYILVSAACIGGYYLRLRQRPFLGGLCFGLFTPIKYFPVVPLVYFSFRREWRLVLGGMLAALAVVITSISLLGWRLHQEFLDSVLGAHLAGHLSMQDPFAVSFQSFDSLYRRLFIFDSVANPRPWLAVPMLRLVLLVASKLVLTLVALATLLRLASTEGEAATGPSIGILGILTLLIAPATASYHMLLLWLPLALLVRYLLSTGARSSAWVLLIAYAVLGFLPAQATTEFVGHGLLTILAYHRLLLLLLMFLVAVAAVWRATVPRTPHSVKSAHHLTLA